MKSVKTMQRKQGQILGILGGILLLTSVHPVYAKDKNKPETLTQTVVTLIDHAHHTAGVPPIQSQDVLIKEDGKQIQVMDWKPIPSDPTQAAANTTQLVILIDDALQVRSGINFSDIGKFILQLPASTQVALGYMQYGRTMIVAGFDADRATVAKSIRLPTSIVGVTASPYFCLSDLAKNWPDQGHSAAVRQVLMITDGIDRYFSPRSYDPSDPYVNAAIKDANVNRMIISSIYFHDTGFADRGLNASFVGGNYLTQVASETGGKMYSEGLGNPVTFVPFLKDYQQRLANTFLLTFGAHGSGLKLFKIKTKVHGVRLETADKVHVGQIISQSK